MKLSSRTPQMSERAITNVLIDTRNYLTDEERAVVNRYSAMVVRELRSALDAQELHYLKVTKPEMMPFAFMEFGRHIRNEYELWMPEHEVTSIWVKAEAEIPLERAIPAAHTEALMMSSDGRMAFIQGSSPLKVDDHPCHPDNFSARVILELRNSL